MKFLLMIALAISVSCSKSPNSQNNIIKDGDIADNNLIDFGEVKIAVPLSGIVPSSSLDFASLDFKQSGVQDLQITYSPSSGSLTLGASDFDTSLLSPFTIQSNGCLTTLLPRKSCTIKLQLSNSQSLSDDQNLTSLIKIKGSDISLTGILKKDLTDYSAPAASFSVSPLFLNFGSFKNGESKELSIAVKNNGSAGSSVSISSISNPNVSISYNSCPVSPLLLGARVSCVVRLKYLGAAAEVKNNENLIKIANYQVTHSATVTSPSVSEPETLAIEPQVSATAVSMSQPDNQSRTISFTNTGTLPLVAPVSAVSSDNGIQIVSVSCAGGLARSKICDISYNIISAQLPSGASTQTIRLQSGTLASNIFSLNLDIVPNEVLCVLADAQANSVNLSNSTSSIQGMKVGNDVSQCILSANACNQYYSLSGDSKSCSAQTLACSASDAQENGWTITSAATYSGNRIGSDVSSCNVLSCASNYEINGKDCTAIACTQANSGIANVLAVTGTKVSGCLVASCLNEYEQVGNTCVGSSCTTANSQGNGISSVLNVATVSGNINDDSCLVTTCNQYYKNAVDNRSCNPKLCTELNGTELSSLGYNLTGATINGTYNSCTVSCNSAFQQVAVDGKSCEDKTPSGTILFAQDYTKLLTPNVVNITSTNAQSLQFYSDAGCVTPAGVSLALPLSSTNLTLSPGDGTKTVYAKFINAGLFSACMSDTIILDQTLPVVAVTAPLLNANIAGNSLIISGTCSELNAPTVSVGVTLNGVTQNIDCASGLFTSTFNITSVPVASQTISLSATDLAGNTGTSTSSFNRINCTAFQTLAGNSCTDNDPTGTIAFAQDYTRVLTPNVVNITSTNGQQIQFYSDASCLTTVGVALSLPLASTNLTLSATDGVKNAYAKILNGSKSSICLTDNIILDQTATTLAVTAPLLNANIAGNSLVISGTCSELNSPTVSVGITLNGVTQTQACASGLFSSTFNITAVPVASQTISLSVTDLAGNVGTATSTFNRINCTAFQDTVGNSCVDKDPSGTILFASDFTKVLSPNTVNITSLNSQQLQFYSDAGCTTTAGVAISLPAASTSLTLSPGDGTKTAYAKFINGSKTSICMSDSIVLDTTGPILTITTPANNSNITANSIQIAGSCGDASSVNLVLSTINQNIACSSGSYTFSSVDISTLITGTYSINISATDSLGNNGSATNSINILRCNADQEPSGSICVYKNVLTPEISISNSYIHNSITYVSSSSLTFSLGTTQNAKTFVVFDFLSDCNNELVGSCSSNPLNPACNSLNRAAFDVTMSMTYSPTIIPNSAKTIYGYYTNGDKKTSCISKTFTYNNPVVAVSSTKPIEVIKTISNFVPTYVNLGLAVTNDIKVNGTNLNIAPTTVTGTNANGSFQSAVLAVPYDNLSSGITTTLSGTASAGKITECDSNIFGVGFNCSFTDTTFSSILDTYYISENGYTPIYLFLAPNHSKVVPYKIYKSTMLPIRTGNLADVITTGTLSMYPINFNNELYFIGNNASVNTKLMKTNGTTITEVASGIGTNQNSGQTWPVVYNGELFLSLKDTAAVNKIYKTDGATYFKKAMEIRVTASPDTWREPIVFENSIFFSSSNGTDQDIYRYNGTNPVVFSNIRTGSDFSIHLNPFVFGSRMYFRATANGTISNIYHTSANLIKLFSNLNASVGVSNVTRPVLFNGFMYFSSYAKTGTVSEFKLYKTDGTTITQVTNLHSSDTLGNGTYGEYPYNLISHNGFLYFNGQNSSGYFKLYKLDTTDKITEISNTNPSGNDVSFPLNVSVPQLMTYPVVCNGELFAIMNNSSGLSKIFKVEASRVVQVTDIRPGLSDSPLDLACSNNILYFKAGSSAGTAAKLWKLETEIIQ